MRMPPGSRLAASSRLLFGLAGAVLIWIATSRYGPGLTADSAKYLSAAESCARGQGLVEFDGRPLVEHPPFYPLVIAAVHRLSGWDLLLCARVLGAVVFGLIVALFGWLASRHLGESPLLVSLAPLVALVSAVLFRVGVMAWTEPLFILLVVGFLLQIEMYRDQETGPRLAGLAVVAGLATLTRYLGISLTASGAAWLLVHHRARPRLAAIRVLAFVVLASLPLGLWAARNRWVAGTWLGSRDPSMFGLATNLEAVRAELLYWFFPARTFPLLVLRWGVLGLGLALLLIMIGRAWRHGEGSVWRSRMGRMMPLALFVGSYALILVAGATRVAFDALDGRLLSPLYLPLGLLFLGLAEPAIRTLPLTVPGRKGGLLLALLLGAWLIYPLRAIVLDAEARIHDGAGGINTTHWRGSEFVRYLRRHPPSTGEVVYCNSPDALFVLAGIRSRWTPERHGWNSRRPGPSLSELEGTWPEAPSVRLIWFHAQPPDSFLYGLDDLREAVAMSLETEFDDGAIFLISPRRRQPASGPDPRARRGGRAIDTPRSVR